MSLHKVTFYTDYTETLNGTEVWVRLPGTNGATWKLSDGAELEEIIPLEEPFIPGWYGVYRTDGSMYQVLQILSASSFKLLETSKSPSTLKKVSVVPDEASAPGPVFKVGDVVRVKHAFEYNPHAGKLGSIVAHNADWVPGKHRVKLQDSGECAYFDADRLEFVSAPLLRRAMRAAELADDLEKLDD